MKQVRKQEHTAARADHQTRTRAVAVGSSFQLRRVLDATTLAE